MTKKESQEKALKRAIENLKHLDLNKQCIRLGLPLPEDDELYFRALGMNLVLKKPSWDVINIDTGSEVKSSDKVLVFHYVLCKENLEITNNLITFRDLSGGQFYWQPFISRTIKPLVARIGNDIELLKKNLNRFDWEPEESAGDFSARIHCIGNVYIKLIYHKGDDEFPPGADILFDEGIKKVFVTEDVAVLTSRICIGLL